MDARAVVTDRCANIGLERSPEGEAAADAETYDTDFFTRHLGMFRKPFQTSAAIGIEMHNWSLRGVLLAAGAPGVIEGDHRSRRFNAPINFRGSNNNPVPGQPHAET